MTELQATLEFQVELSKFYNVDLFQRGYYQVRTSLKTAQKAPVKIELSLPKNSDCKLIFPASVINGVAVSKTFQILYRNEDVSVDDVVLFKVHMLVDPNRIEESIEQADFQLNVDLWFTEEEVGPEYQDKLQCISQRVLKLNLNPNQGLHHHVPVLFDYFHLSVICVSVHATLLALHQSYISIPGRVPKSAWTKEQAPLESVYFSASSRPNTPGFNNLDIKLREACAVHKTVCQVLLSAYESLQTSFQTIVARLPPYCKKIRIEQIDCHKKLDLILQVLQAIDDEDEFLQTAQSDVSQLCAANVIMWSQYIELVTLHERVTHQLAKEHHIQRVKKFAEAFFTCEHPNSDAITCYDASTHSHVELATLVRNSQYFHNLPVLNVDCTEIDGDQSSTPIVFEDIFCEVQPVKQFKWSAEDAVVMRSRSRDSRSDNSSEFSTDSSPKFKRSSKLNFIKNIKPETFKRPSVTGGGQSRNVTTNVAGITPTNATLVGYKKVNTDNEHLPVVELGTLSPAPNLTSGRLNQIAASMPSLLGQNHAQLITASMPDLNRSSSLKEGVTNRTLFLSGNSVDEVNLRRRLTLPSEVIVTQNAQNQGQITGDLTENRDCMLNGLVSDGVEMGLNSERGQQSADVDSLSQSDSSTSGDIQNGYFPSASDTDLQTATQHSHRLECSNSVAVNSNNTNSSSSATEFYSATCLLSEKQSDSGRSSSLATRQLQSEPTDHFQTEQSIDSGVASLHDVTLSYKDSVECELEKQSPSQSVKANETNDNNQHKSLMQNNSASSESSDYMNTECTIMELLKEEYIQSQQNTADNCHTPRSSRTGLGMRAGMGMPGRAIPITNSSSSPELGNRDSQTTTSRMLVSPVMDKTINFIAAKENLRKNIKYNGCVYSDFPTQCSTVPYFWPLDTHHHHSSSQSDTAISAQEESSVDDGLHLVVCVHGLDGNSADLRLVRTYIELAMPGSRIDFLMSERNQPDTFADFEVMTDKLVEEILYHIDIYGIQPTRLSFVGHSLGNLIIRSALSRTGMAPLLNKLHTFLSLSGPHLGTLYNSSGLVNMGMWFMQKWKKSGSLLQLSLKDHTDPRQTFLYKLSMKSGLEYFKNILLVSSTQDRYVPYHSSRIELCKSAVKDTSGMGGVYAEMVHNILQPIIYKSNVTFIRYDVFHALQNTANSIIGRAAHIAVLDSEIFIEKFITVAALKYFK